MQTIFAIKNMQINNRRIKNFLKEFSCKKKTNNFYFSWKVTKSRYKYYFYVEFFDGGRWKKHFPVSFSGDMAQLMNFVGLLIFPFKWGDRFSRRPRSKKTKLLHSWTWTSTSTRHVTLKSPLLLQFPYCELFNNDNKQLNYILMNVLFCTRALVADFSKSPK